MPARDREFEREFLRQAARKAGVDGTDFERLVLDRLDRVGEKHGDTFLWATTVRRFLAEICQEGEDVAGWSVGAAQCADLDNFSDDRRVEIVTGLIRLAALGAQVEVEAQRLTGLLED